MPNSKMVPGILPALAALLLLAAAAAAAPYQLGPGDVLEVRFWQDPSLNSSVRVGQDGKISLDIIGEIEAAGKTPEELQADIVRQMSRLNKRISQAVVRVTEYNFNHVFVLGQVLNPGKLTFEEIPDLVTILHEAGWITTLGDLTRVTVIRGGDQSGQVEVVDVARAIAASSVEELPEIHRQDAIEVPPTPTGLPGPELADQVERKNVIYVVGAVNQPGAIAFQEGLDITDAITLAGGYAENAVIKDVKVLTKDGYYAQSLHYNLEEYAARGASARYTLRQEDAVVVPYERRGFLDRNLGTIVTILGAATSALLLYENLRPSDDEENTPATTLRR